MTLRDSQKPYPYYRDLPSTTIKPNKIGRQNCFQITHIFLNFKTP